MTCNFLLLKSDIFPVAQTVVLALATSSPWIQFPGITRTDKNVKCVLWIKKSRFG